MSKPNLDSVTVAGHAVTHGVVSNIRQASHDSGISFSYLMAQAAKESNFKSDVGSHASSAAGLFQFTKGTWLQLVKTHGAEMGLGEWADKIEHTDKGDYTVADPQLRQQIYDLRRDPQLSAAMAGQYAKDNKAWLEKKLGRPVDSTDLYMAHFLGPGGAVKVLKARAENPEQPAADVLPQAAHKNHSVFYDSNHSARSVAAVYDRIHHAIDKPMKQYAKLEGPTTVTESAHHAGHGHKHHPDAGTTVASAAPSTGQPDLQWPFETGQWPPAAPLFNPATNTTKSALVQDTDALQKAAFGDPSDSSIASGTMPPSMVASLAPDSNQLFEHALSRWASADRISAPMPPSPGTPSNPPPNGSTNPPTGTPLGKLLTSMKKGLFG